jgi:hypothetical protein
MIPEDGASVKLEDLNVGALGLKSWESLTPNQWRERMDDMHWILEMLYCSQVLGGLQELAWDAAKTMTFSQYMETIKKKPKVA